ncbi:g278 [Coccomyxa viridis]|uniref:G278 protein n=1 Tax=Coccomyxa viridis TaxID=1274662 RepID=A0ABP1FJE1_9CHLO
MASAVVAGLAVGAAAYAGKAAIEIFTRYRSAPRLRQFYKGGFLPEMTKREAAQILGQRESAGEERIREAHLRIMKANHPDLGGSSYIAEKVNEAKDMLLGKNKRTSHF